MKTYYVMYMLFEGDKPKGINVAASNRWEAYDKVVYELIPEKEGQMPYGAYVSSVTYSNGNYHRFNTFWGMPY